MLDLIRREPAVRVHQDADAAREGSGHRDLGSVQDGYPVPTGGVGSTGGRASSVARRIASGRSCSTVVAPRNPRRRKGRGSDMVQNLANHLRLMLVTDDLLLGERDPVAVCQAAERAGVTAGPLRLKQATPRALLDVARRLRAALRVPVIVNDRAAVARG